MTTNLRRSPSISTDLHRSPPISPAAPSVVAPSAPPLPWPAVLARASAERSTIVSASPTMPPPPPTSMPPRPPTERVSVRSPLPSPSHAGVLLSDSFRPLPTLPTLPAPSDSFQSFSGLWASASKSRSGTRKLGPPSFDELFVVREVPWRSIRLRRPRRGKRFHLYVSRNNLGASALMQELVQLPSMASLRYTDVTTPRRPRRPIPPDPFRSLRSLPIPSDPFRSLPGTPMTPRRPRRLMRCSSTSTARRGRAAPRARASRARSFIARH